MRPDSPVEGIDVEVAAGVEHVIVTAKVAPTTTGSPAPGSPEVATVSPADTAEYVLPDPVRSKNDGSMPSTHSHVPVDDGEPPTSTTDPVKVTDRGSAAPNPTANGADG